MKTLNHKIPEPLIVNHKTQKTINGISQRIESHGISQRIESHGISQRIESHGISQRIEWKH